MEIVIDLRLILQKMKSFPGKVRNYWSNLSKKDRRDFIKFEYGFLFGFLVWIVISEVFAITATIMLLPLVLLAGFFFWLVKFSGFDDDFVQLIKDIDSTNNLFDKNLVIVDAFPLFIKAITSIGRIIFDTLTISFPVLLDINLDIDWLHVSLPYIFRTLFNVVQFVLLFYFTNKIRYRIKRKIRERVKVKSYVWFEKNPIPEVTGK